MAAGLIESATPEINTNAHGALRREGKNASEHTRSSRQVAKENLASLIIRLSSSKVSGCPTPEPGHRPRQLRGADVPVAAMVEGLEHLEQRLVHKPGRVGAHQLVEIHGAPAVATADESACGTS